MAIEALWDGDTGGWLVAFVTVVERPGRQHARFDDVNLALIRSGTDLRVFNGNVPPWPEAVEATRLGRAMAEARGVPFYFFDPATPDIDQPRWWDPLI